ncbi:MAG: hypothetical protein IJP78_06725 [Clostridia bacterium]|nr:hypothetical protein [Clostridia bacterium]
MKEYKLIAPDIDRLLLFFDRGHINPSIPSKALVTAMEPLFSMLSDLAPMENNEEVKTIWLQIPRGSMDDYDRYEDLLEYGEIKTRDEYKARWLDDYPNEVKWYRLVLVESHNKNHELSFRGVSLDNKMIISAELDRNEGPSSSVFTEEAAVALCALIANAAAVSMGKVREGTYNEDVNAHLPYWFRTGVIKRNILWENDPAWKEDALDGLSAETVTEFRKLLDSGANEPDKIGRITSFTANDFFRACACGYRALDYDCGTLSPSALYLRYADGRDEGLTGTGHGLNEGPGIDFNDPAAWDVWFFSQRGGGHPWEVVRGGNSTHVDLFVCHDIADPAAAHADGIAFFQQHLIPEGQASESLIDFLRFYAVFKNADIVPLVRQQFFIRFFLIVLFIEFRQKPVALLPGRFQLFCRCFFRAAIFFRIDPDSCIGVPFAVVIDQHNLPGRLVIIQGIKGIVFLRHAIAQHGVREEMTHIGEKRRATIWIIFLKTAEHFHPARELQIHETVRRIRAGFTAQKAMDTHIEIPLFFVEIKEDVF